MEDINDNKPEFDRDSYSAAIREVRWKLCIIILLVEDFFKGLGFLSSELKVLQSKYCIQINIPWLVTKTWSIHLCQMSSVCASTKGFHAIFVWRYRINNLVIFHLKGKQSDWKLWIWRNAVRRDSPLTESKAFQTIALGVLDERRIVWHSILNVLRL